LGEPFRHGFADTSGAGHDGYLTGKIHTQALRPGWDYLDVSFQPESPFLIGRKPSGVVMGRVWLEDNYRYPHISFRLTMSERPEVTWMVGSVGCHAQMPARHVCNPPEQAKSPGEPLKCNCLGSSTREMASA
jgi:hypothetical protein